MTVWFGNGDGTFTTESTQDAGFIPTAIAPGYFSGSGVEDFAVTVGLDVAYNNRGEYLKALLGSPSDSFTSYTTPMTTYYNPTSVVAADFNGDGNVDLAMGIEFGGELTQFFWGTGVGVFGPGPTTGTLAVPTSLAVGDFNGDGIPDLAVGESNGTVQIQLGNGDGTFTALATSLATNAPTDSMVAGDFNGDGLSDLVVASYGTYGVTVLSAATETASATSSSGIALPPGTGIHQVVASYAGDSNYKPSISGSIALTAAPLTPSVTLKSSANPVALGGSATFTATISGAGAVPTGSVTFYWGAAQECRFTLNSSGTAACAIGPFANAGPQSITASYSGDIHYAGATSQASTLTVTPGTPKVGLTSSATSIIQGGNPATFTATVSGAGVTPTGTVTFLDGTTTLNTSTLSGGEAAFSINALAFGKHSITASYSGDSNYAAATSAAVILDVTGGATPTVTLTASASSTAYGTAITFKSTATGNSGIPTGTVAFFNGATQLSTGTLNSGIATYSTTLPVGQYSIAASYSGNDNYAAATSNLVMLSVNLGIPTVKLTSSPTSATYGEAITFAAKLTGSDGTPTGTLQFFDGATRFDTTNLSSGIATRAEKLTAGEHTITASYEGNAVYAAAKSNALKVKIDKATPTVTLKASATTVKAGTNITFKATLSGAGATPTGTVKFLNNEALLGTGTLNNIGETTFATEKLSMGKHTIAASYQGNADYLSKASAAVVVTVTK